MVRGYAVCPDHSLLIDETGSIARPPWREDVGPDWTRFPIARLHYTRTTGLWTLYWRDQKLKYHRYQPLDPSPRIQDLLDYLDSRADPIFWG